MHARVACWILRRDDKWWVRSDDLGSKTVITIQVLHHPDVDAGRGSRREECSARVLATASNHPHDSTPVLVVSKRRLGQPLRHVICIKAGSEGVEPVSNAYVDHPHSAGVLLAGQDDQPDLETAEGDGDIGHQGVLCAQAGVGIQSARHVDGKDQRSGAAHSARDTGNGLAQLSSRTNAEQPIDHDVCGLQERVAFL